MEHSIFNDQMTSTQASLAFFRAADGKSKEEYNRLAEEYFAILPEINKRERKLAEQGWIIE